MSVSRPRQIRPNIRLPYQSSPVASYLTTLITHTNKPLLPSSTLTSGRYQLLLFAASCYYLYITILLTK
ncbi:hypothetical protein LY78DRAFT_497643 [Colletotrichum sublineola]|nr:hypothetical protein LY78DRAFT_497643 [Colletotrichum sublineola]